MVFLDCAERQFSGQAEARGTRHGQILGVGIASVLGVHRIGRSEPQQPSSRATEGLQQLLHNLIGSIGRPDIGRPQAETQVIGQRPAQFQSLPVRIPVKSPGQFHDRCGHLLTHASAGRIRVLVHVQCDRHVQLGRTIGLLPH